MRAELALTLRETNFLSTQTNMKVTAALVFVIACVFACNQLHAGRSVDLPFTLSFDQNDYSDLVWTGGGSTHAWQSSDGWSGGAARFTPPTSDQQATGLGQFLNLGNDNAAQLNIRFLIRHGLDYITNFQGTKFIIMVRSPNDAQHQRPMVYDGKANDGTGDFLSYGPAVGTVKQWDNTVDNGCWISGDESFKMYPGHYFNEWICIEMEFVLATGWTNLYITTQDGAQSGLYLTYRSDAGCQHPDPPQTGGQFDYIDVIGGYWNTGMTASAETWFMIDELRIDDGYIGPPAGFIASSSVTQGSWSQTHSPRVRVSGDEVVAQGLSPEVHMVTVHSLDGRNVALLKKGRQRALLPSAGLYVVKTTGAGAMQSKVIVAPAR